MPRLATAFLVLLAMSLAGMLRAQVTGDSSPHTRQFITVDTDVKLEVLDWGGSGRPVVLLTGLGDDAHVFDTFAPKLTATYHVYGITRRGFGASSAPPAVEGAYSPDRLGDDVLAVQDALKLTRPVIIGHSIGGEELSSIGSRHRERVAGLVYLDAGYIYAYWDRAAAGVNAWVLDLPELQRKLMQLEFLGQGPADARPVVKDLRENILPQIESDLREMQKRVEQNPAAFVFGPTPRFAAYRAISASYQKYTNIPVPVLAIYAFPHEPSFGPEDDAQIKVFEKGVPSSRVVRLPHADHYVYRSNEADVLREINAFIGTLPL